MPTELGQAQGKIVIDLSDLQNVRVTTQQVGQEAERNLARIGTGAAKAQNAFAGVQGQLTQLAGALGISLGAAALVQVGKFAIAADAVATAYARQNVAALSLAGSQEQLNSLLDAYARATGGAISKAQSLADVTRLQAVGFADSAQELETFARAARGISVATGQAQDYVISQLQLAIANQSTMRLDQLGLGVGEVTERIDELKAANKGLTDEMAYQQAILELAEQKFGTLVDSSEAQATGIERLTKAWADYRLELGRTEGALPQRLDQAANFFAGELTTLSTGMAERNSPVANVGPLNNIIDDKRAEIKALEQSLAELRAIDSVDVSPAIIQTKNLIDDLRHSIEGLQRQVASEMAAGPSIGAPPWMASVNRAQDAAIKSDVRTPEQTDVIEQWFTDVQAIEQDAAQQRIATTRQYEQQRNSVIDTYQTMLVREAQDFALQRTRQEQRLADQIADIHEAAAERELDIANDAAKRELAAAAALADSIARAREDAARQEARAVRDLERNIGKMRENSAEREAEWTADLNESIAEARESSNAKLIELEQDFQQSREHAAQDSSDRILGAASRLDANAVFEEQKRFERESKQANEAHQEAISDEEKRLREYIDAANLAHQERITDERANLAESIADAQEAHRLQRADAQEALNLRIEDEKKANAARLAAANLADLERLKEAKLNDAQRILDMKAAWAQEKIEEDIDRGIRLTRLETDHQKQLGAMATAHNNRMTQIGVQEAELKTARQTAFLAELADLGLYHTEWIKGQKKLQEDALKLFDAWWEAVNKRFEVGTAPSLANPHGGMQNPPAGQPMVIPDGIGPAPQVDIYAPGGGAMPINPHTNNATQGGARTSSVNVGTITVNAAPGQSEEQTAEEFEKALIRIANKVSS